MNKVLGTVAGQDVLLSTTDHFPIVGLTQIPSQLFKPKYNIPDTVTRFFACTSW